MSDVNVKEVGIDPKQLDIYAKFSSYPVKKLLSLKYLDISLNDFDDGYGDFIASITIEDKKNKKKYKLYTDVVEKDYVYNLDKFDEEVKKVIRKHMGFIFVSNSFIYFMISNKFQNNVKPITILSGDKENSTMFIEKGDKYRLGFILEELN